VTVDTSINWEHVFARVPRGKTTILEKIRSLVLNDASTPDDRENKGPELDFTGIDDGVEDDTDADGVEPGDEVTIDGGDGTVWTVCSVSPVGEAALTRHDSDPRFEAVEALSRKVEVGDTVTIDTDQDDAVWKVDRRADRERVEIEAVNRRPRVEPESALTVETKHECATPTG
jgi:phosphohistidine swiveling domain-containing protein